MNDFNDEDIKILIKITLRTQTINPIKILLPFHKKFCPQIIITPNNPLLIPIYHTLQLVAQVDKQKERATINLKPLMQFLNHQHYINVQTYLDNQPQTISSRYTFHIEFAQIVVWEQTTNYLQVIFKKLLLKTGSLLNKKKINLRVITSQGSYWTSKSIEGSQIAAFQQSTTIMFHNLLDTVTIQIRSQNQKLCEMKKFIFELLGQGSKVHNLKGQIIKQGSIKIVTKTSLPMMMID